MNSDFEKVPRFVITSHKGLGYFYAKKFLLNSDLKLNSDFVEGFRDDRNEDVLDHPGQEEDHGREVQGGLPVLGRVSGPVHDVHPTLLTGS